jgi:glycosyltransferase involved in cell wall biosynthesis
MMTCSVIVPIHNESEHLETFIPEFWENLKGLKQNVVEIHLVENGSTDDSFQICEKLAAALPGVVIPHSISIPSYGEAIKNGILASTGDIICILECDIMNIEFLSNSLSTIEQGKGDFVVASKRHPESVDARPLKRRMLTLLFNLLLKINFSFPGTDTHGLKAIRTDVAKLLCDLCITGGEIFQTELVLLAYRMGYKVIEIPINIREQRETKVSIVKRIPKVLHLINDLKVSLDRFPAKQLSK